MSKLTAIDPSYTDIICPIISGDFLYSPVRVTHKSPKTYRRAVYKIARYFKLEFGYDNIQYCEEEQDPNHVAFLWIHPQAQGESKEVKVPCVGACCFRLRNLEKSGYGLQWVWIHPYFRRHGFLTEAWPKFAEEFGSFCVEPPLAPAMKAFLVKHNYDPKGWLAK